jgi:hypothetical protein
VCALEVARKSEEVESADMTAGLETGAPLEFSETGSYCVLWPGIHDTPALPPECGDYRHVPSCPALSLEILIGCIQCRSRDE